MTKPIVDSVAAELCALEFGVPYDKKIHGDKQVPDWAHSPGINRCQDSNNTNTRFLRKHTAKVPVRKKFVSRCAYMHERGLCGRHRLKAFCPKSCTGKGTDNSTWSQHNFTGIVLSNKTYPSVCAFWKVRPLFSPVFRLVLPHY